MHFVIVGSAHDDVWLCYFQNQYSALHLASQSGSVAVVQLLLDRGANLHTVTYVSGNSRICVLISVQMLASVRGSTPLRHCPDKT